MMHDLETRLAHADPADAADAVVKMLMEDGH